MLRSTRASDGFVTVVQQPPFYPHPSVCEDVPAAGTAVRQALSLYAAVAIKGHFFAVWVCKKLKGTACGACISPVRRRTWIITLMCRVLKQL